MANTDWFNKILSGEFQKRGQGYHDAVKRADAIALAYEALSWQRNAVDWARFPDGPAVIPGSLDPEQLIQGWRERRMMRRGAWDLIWLRHVRPLLEAV